MLWAPWQTLPGMYTVPSRGLMFTVMLTDVTFTTFPESSNMPSRDTSCKNLGSQWKSFHANKSHWIELKVNLFCINDFSCAISTISGTKQLCWQPTALGAFSLDKSPQLEKCHLQRWEVCVCSKRLFYWQSIKYYRVSVSLTVLACQITLLAIPNYLMYVYVGSDHWRWCCWIGSSWYCQGHGSHCQRIWYQVCFWYYNLCRNCEWLALALKDCIWAVV